MKNRKLNTLILILLAAGAFLLAVNLLNPQQQTHPFFDQFDSYPLVIAHADDTGQGVWPGSTLLFLKGVSELGVDVLELDVHMSKDGHIVVMHDDTVDRTTNGSGKIREMTLKELKTLEVAGAWSNDGGETYPYQGEGVRIPTLAEVFYLFPDTPMNIEMKQEEPSMAQPLCDMIRHFGKGEQVLIPSFSDKAMAEFRTACPEVATAASSSEARNFVILNFLLLTNLLTPEFEAFQVPETSSGIPVVIPHFVKSAHDSGLQVHVWTVNDPDDMKRFIEMGVDGIMTDRPDLLMEIIEQQ